MRYVVWPGYVKSQYDGQLHFISGPELMRLYGVPRKQCVVVDSREPGSVTGFKMQEGDINLFPRQDGKYHLSKKVTK